MRDMTNSMPSNAVSSAAIVASVAERNRCQAARPTSRIASVPVSATAMRQPNEEVMPNRCSPAPIIHLPNGGWTMKSGSVPYTVGTWPCVKNASGSGMFAGVLRSWPYRIIDQPCLT